MPKLLLNTELILTLEQGRSDRGHLRTGTAHTTPNPAKRLGVEGRGGVQKEQKAEFEAHCVTTADEQPLLS